MGDFTRENIVVLYSTESPTVFKFVRFINKYLFRSFKQNPQFDQTYL